MAVAERQAHEIDDAKPRPRRLPYAVRKLFARVETFFPFRSLTRRIVFLNLFALAILVSGILYLDRFRAKLIDTKVESLLVQGEIIAGAIADSAGVDGDRKGDEPESDQAFVFGDLGNPGQDAFGTLQFTLDPERTAPTLRRLIKPTGTRARIYDRDGNLILDSDNIYGRGEVLRREPDAASQEQTGFLRTTWRRIRTWLWYQDLPRYRDIGEANGRAYPEVVSALTGTSVKIVRLNENSGLVVSVAVPVRRLNDVLGVLLLSTRGGSIDAIVGEERLRIIKFALFAAIVALLLSVLLARTIAGPIQRLSASADRVRRTIGVRATIPDYTHRTDEIGDLSGSLSDMTASLYQRIEAIERFAADVAHELKNPLTSLRSAAETLTLVKSEDARADLIAVIQHDVKRLDRLLSDISDASRLDAELAREGADPVDMAELLRTIVPTYHDPTGKDPDRISLDIAKPPARSNGYVVHGHDIRLGQVVTNLLDNAISFTPEDGKVHVRARRLNGEIEIAIEDEGPGIPSENLKKIFQRFYTDRPGHEGFGNHSGLGLNISEQIIEAHDGRIWAENKASAHGVTKKPDATGARFVIRLPAARAEGRQDRSR